MGVPFPALKTMVTVFLLLMGNMSPAVLSSSIPLSRVKVIASEVVTAGTSMRCGSLQAENNYKVTCVIKVENWTCYPLMAPVLRIANDGAVTTSPTVILPGKSEAFAVRKAADVHKGVYGTVSWKLDGARRRFVLMFSAPYNFNSYSNWMGLGITSEGVVEVASGNTWWKEMYYKKNSSSMEFTRKEFNRNTDPFIYSNDKFEVEGVMTNGHHAQISVIVRPSSHNWKDLAYVIRQKLD